MPDHNEDGLLRLTREYQLGRLEALHSIKKDIMRWFGSAAAIITIVVGLLAAVGIDRTIETSVYREISRRLDDQSKQITQAYIDVGILNQNIGQKISEIKSLENETSRNFRKIK